eukprot:NODE_5163_length_321_cov_286.216912_g4552_i0.p2 GENE.NODE_5163_length_321_cov_286.216912_g4552_i0~~NODE_5163_length_321_cov_286.216912_g4552_i0.p2  ORF type:complete len:75 (-),score=17.19 NODE_5163_length_321_cov_286.216912_g4552_i0:97-300(-)
MGLQTNRLWMGDAPCLEASGSFWDVYQKVPESRGGGMEVPTGTPKTGKGLASSGMSKSAAPKPAPKK